MSTWVDRRLREYASGKKVLIAYRKTLDREDPAEKLEVSIVGGMISDLQYGMDRMRGKHPESRRGVQATDAYRYAELRDMDLIPALDLSIDEPEHTISDEQKRKLIQILLKLSDRERQCYLLHTAQGMSWAEIGKELDISKATVQTHIKRAQAKVQQAI
jgi:RNA polymerase sigma factor (sigma-70 family)